MTYVLQPFYDNMKNIPVEVREILHFEYTEKMDAIGKESRKNTLFSWTSLEILDASPSGFAYIFEKTNLAGSEGVIGWGAGKLKKRQVVIF